MKLLFVLLLSMGAATTSFSQDLVKGFNLTENGQLSFHANPEGEPKSEAQIAIDKVAELGANHIVLNVRAKQVGPRSSTIIPLTGTAPIGTEAREIASLVRYAHSLGMTVGLRPILFVVGPKGEFPFHEGLQDGSSKTWWHGNIQPDDPNRWFEQFQIYLDRYVTIGRLAKIDDFTIGAELYSMTVGLEDQWPEHPHGFPGRWLELLRYVKQKLPNARIAYDINFTDDTIVSQGLTRAGGELERWRYRLVDLAEPADEQQYQIWKNLLDFWNELDVIGIDMYRSLAFGSDQLPSSEEALEELLSQRARTYSTQLDTALLDIEIISGGTKEIVLKEVGYRSVEKAFIDPFTYATAQADLNVQHQALSYKALFKGFWEPNYLWFRGIAFWDIPLDPSLHGPTDKGFSPLGKTATENVIRDYFKGN